MYQINLVTYTLCYLSLYIQLLGIKHESSLQLFYSLTTEVTHTYTLRKKVVYTVTHRKA